eukprot:200453-Pelagomonas_calceolata.AAC.5
MLASQLSTFRLNLWRPSWGQCVEKGKCQYLELIDPSEYVLINQDLQLMDTDLQLIDSYWQPF